MVYQKIVSAGLDGSAFLLFAVALALPSGYSYGAVGLLVLCAAGLPLVRGARWERAVLWLAAIVLAMGLLWGMSFDGRSVWTGSDYWPKYWLAALCLLVASRIGVRWCSVQWGIGVGGLGALAVATYQYVVLHMDKATGHTNAIQYGGLAMYLGIAAWCLALFGGLRKAMAVALWACGACGVIASLLSETRGAWVVAPLLMAVLVWLLFRHGRAKLALGAVAAALALVVAVMVPYGEKFSARAALALTEMQHYAQDTQAAADTSIGQRMEQWRLAWAMAEQKPITGWGTEGVIEGKQALVDQGVAHPSVMQYGHAHNELLDMWVKRGGLGLALLLLFYGIPLAVFWPTRARMALAASDVKAPLLALRVVASLLPIAYFGFGWTQVFFAHNSGNLFYLFALVVFYAALRQLQGQTLRVQLASGQDHSGIHGDVSIEGAHNQPRSAAIAGGR